MRVSGGGGWWGGGGGGAEKNYKVEYETVYEDFKSKCAHRVLPLSLILLWV